MAGAEAEDGRESEAEGVPLTQSGGWFSAFASAVLYIPAQLEAEVLFQYCP